MATFQWRAMGALALVSAIAIVMVSMNWLRTASPVGAVAVRPSEPAQPAVPAPILFDEIGESFQGPLQQKDKDEGWMALTIRATDAAADPIRFSYTFNVFTVGKKDLSGRGDNGALSIKRGTIHFGDYTGRIRRDGRGRAVLQSNPIDGPPYWLLEPVASTSATGTE